MAFWHEAAVVASVSSLAKFAVMVGGLGSISIDFTAGPVAGIILVAVSYLHWRTPSIRKMAADP
jgi:hypothetical protein